MNWEVSTAPMCRACMEIDGIFIPMDDGSMSRKNLLRKLVDLTSIEIDKNDGLPTMLCTKCAYRTNAFYRFKLQVRETEKKLKKMFEVVTDPVKEEIFENNHLNDSSTESSSVLQQEILNSINEDTPKDQIFQILQVTDDELDGALQEICVEPQKIQLLKDDRGIEVTNVLNSNNVEYTIAYMPDDTVNTVLSRNSVRAVLDNQDMSLQDATNESETLVVKSVNKPSSKLQSTQVLEDLARTDLVETIPEESNIEVTYLENTEWHSIPDGDPNCLIENNENQEVNTNSLGSEDSDSEYFIGPKEDIVGSLNDTITRIKEVKKEANQMEYQCTLCLQNYSEISRVLIHIVESHVPSTGPFFCIVCEKDCESRRELRLHVKTHTGQFPYTCFICNKAYAMKRYLKRHMVCHADFPKHRCPKCGIRYKLKSELETHLSTHGPAYECSQCSRVFNHKGNYKRHLMSHLDPLSLHLPKYPCNICGKRFLNNRTLETHLRVHTGEKPYKCEVCDKRFSQQGNLLNHLRSVHSNPRSHTCNVCGKSFNQKATLKDHTLLHTGEKPYVCSVCGMAFTFSAAMRRHMWTHSGGKPFGCDVCQARFIGKYDLKRHMRIHSQKPKANKRQNPIKQDNMVPEELMEEIIVLEGETDSETMRIEPILLAGETTQINQQSESEKENVDALFNLIQYG